MSASGTSGARNPAKPAPWKDPLNGRQHGLNPWAGKPGRSIRHPSAKEEPCGIKYLDVSRF